MSYLIERRRGDDYRAQLISIANDRCDASRKYSQPFRDRTLRWYQLYRGLLSGQYHVHKHNIHIPLLYSVIQSDVARKVQTTLGTFPIVDFMARPGEAAYARKQSMLVSSQMYDADTFLKYLDLAMFADLYGAGPYITGFDYRTHKARYTAVETAPLSKKRVQVILERDHTDFNGPNWHPLDPLDFFPEPGKPRIRDMNYAGHQYLLDLEEVRQLVEQGVFDRSEFNRMVSSGGGGGNVKDLLRELRGMPFFSGDQWGANTDPSLRPVLCRDVFGLIPSELAIEGFNWVVLTIANDQFLLRARPFPYWDQLLPYGAAIPNPDPHYFWATGKAEIMEKIQIASNKFTNQVLDLLQLAIDPMWVVSRRAHLDPNNLYSRPGRIFQVEGAPAEQWMPLPVNLQGANLGIQASDILWRWGQQGTGIIEDVAQGMSASSRTTAREFVGRQEAVATRLTMEALVMEKQVIEPMAERFISLSNQFLSLPMQATIMGDSAMVDWVTGRPFEPQELEIQPGDLSYRYRARARGAGSRMSLAGRKSDFITITQAYAQNPVTASALNWIGWSKLMAQVFEWPDMADLINTQEQAADMLDRLSPQTREQVLNPASPVGGADIQTLLGALQPQEAL